MEGNKILDLSNLTEEHFESMKKAFYECMGSGESGEFVFISHRENERILNALKDAFCTTYAKGALCGAAGLAAGYCVGRGIAYFIDRYKAKKLEKEFEEL